MANNIRLNKNLEYFDVRLLFDNFLHYKNKQKKFQFYI